MDAQLRLLAPGPADHAGNPSAADDARPPAGPDASTPRSWRLDPDTRTVGLEGIARARAALRAARRTALDDHATAA